MCEQRISLRPYAGRGHNKQPTLTIQMPVGLVLRIYATVEVVEAVRSIGLSLVMSRGGAEVALKRENLKLVESGSAESTM